jgi:hypothetical protein
MLLTCVDGLPGGEGLRREDGLEILGVNSTLHELLKSGKGGVAPVSETAQIVPPESEKKLEKNNICIRGRQLQI